MVTKRFTRFGYRSLESLSQNEKGVGRTLLSSNLLLPLRIFMGVTFVYAGVQHLTDSAYFDPSKPGYIGHLVSQYAVGSPIQGFLLGVVAPNAVTFGYLVAVGESLIGVAILLGFLFRLAALAGLLLNLTFFLSATWTAFPFYFGSDIVFVMCWLTLLFTGPQAGLSVDSIIAKRSQTLRWLAPRPVQLVGEEPPKTEKTGRVLPVSISEKVKLFPKQVAEVNRAFDRIEQQFVSHEETKTILEFVRAFTLSLGVDRGDASKILQGLENMIRRDAFEEPATR
jgi:uncharacterized membrane protein YphA (DoxX/SURF4 family)